MGECIATHSHRNLGGNRQRKLMSAGLGGAVYYQPSLLLNGLPIEQKTSQHQDMCMNLADLKLRIKSEMDFVQTFLPSFTKSRKKSRKKF
jgi:hypothetical protein